MDSKLSEILCYRNKELAVFKSTYNEVNVHRPQDNSWTIDNFQSIVLYADHFSEVCNHILAKI